MIGQIIDGRYHIETLVGHGGMGTVYKAIDLTENKNVAIKVLNVNMTQGVAVSRLHREFRVLTRLDHPRIVKAYAYGFHQERPYLVLEYLFGHTLSTELGTNFLHRTRLLHIARQIADALIYLHAQSLIHRDLKPGNIMLLPPGDSPQVKIMDFGLVRINQQSIQQLTQEGSTLGTVAYMAPEQAQGFAVDFRADLYAFGAILYQMATSRPPFVHENPATVLLQHITTLPPPPRRFNPEIDEALSSFILDLLAKDPLQRPASTPIVANRIKQLIKGDVAPVLHTPLNKANMVTHIPLIGRETPFQQLVTHWQEVQNGEGQVILLSGVAGVGKGRFLTEARLQARVGDRCFFQGRSREHGSLPYQPIVDILTDLLHHCAPEEKANIPPELQPLLPGLHNNTTPSPTEDAGEARLRLFSACWEFIQQLTPANGMLISIEEIQWADVATLELIGFLAARVHQTSILLVLSYRPEEVEKDSAFAKLLRDLERTPHIHKMKLDLLNREQVGHYLRLALGWERVPDWLIDSFYQATGGNPLFIEETLKVLSAEGQVTEWNNITTSRVTIMGQTSMVLQLPQSVLDLAERRLQSLTADERSILTTAAVLGPEFAFELLQVVSEKDEERLIDVVDTLLAAHLIEELPLQNGEDRYAFSQEALRQALLSNISHRRRRLLHKRTGQAMSTIYDTSEPQFWPALAYHFAEAGQTEKALKFFILAGDDAAEVYAYHEAIAHYTAALALAKETGSIFQLLHIYTQRGHCLEMARLYEDAILNYQEMKETANASNDQLLKLASLLAQAAVYVRPIIVGNISQAQTLSQQALDIARQLDNQDGKARALWTLLNVSVVLGDLAQATAYGEEALTIAQKYHLHEQKALILTNIHPIYMANGQPQKAKDALMEAEKLLRELNDLPRLGEHLGFSAYHYYLTGDYHKALQSAEEAYKVGESVDDLWSQGFGLWAKGYTCLELGQPGEAIETMEMSLRLDTKQTFLPAQVLMRSNLGWAYGVIGAIEQALALAEEAYCTAEEIRPELIPDAQVVLAQMKIRQGDQQTAAELLQKARIVFDQKKERTWLDGFYIHIVEAELALAQNAYEQAIEVIDRFIVPLRRSQVHTYLAEALCLKGEALLAQGDLTQAQDAFLEAYNLTERIGSRRISWLILSGLAHISQQQGDIKAFEQYHQKEEEIINYIADHAGSSDLRQSFLNLVQTRRLTKHLAMSH